MPLLNEENSEKCMPETNIAPNSKDNESSPVRNVHSARRVPGLRVATLLAEGTGALGGEAAMGDSGTEME
jgi:hypothetical protein